MCGRYTLFAPKEDVEERFDARFEGPYERRYNAAPSQELHVVRDVTPGRITTAEWGLQPAWADTRSDAGFIDARAETALEKRSFAPSMAGAASADGESLAGRCLVPADGFYEWAEADDGRQPYRLRRPDDQLFGMAGLWTTWRPTERQAGLGEFDADPADVPVVETVTILTTEPNDVAARVHDRMPVILDRKKEGRWLEADAEGAATLLDPYDGAMGLYPVSHDVNDPANDLPGVVQPLEG
jgi:putative SOS response-associated peptidase YedK